MNALALGPISKKCSYNFDEFSMANVWTLLVTKFSSRFQTFGKKSFIALLSLPLSLSPSLSYSFLFQYTYLFKARKSFCLSFLSVLTKEYIGIQLSEK